MLRYLFLDIICSSKLSFSRANCSWKTDRFSEQTVSADKYLDLSIFSHQMKTIVH